MPNFCHWNSKHYGKTYLKGRSWDSSPVSFAAKQNTRPPLHTVKIHCEVFYQFYLTLQKYSILVTH